MAVQPRDLDLGPAPSQVATKLTPTLTPTTPYVAQKVTMTVTADNPVQVDQQGQWLKFLLGSPNQGIVSYPSLESQQSQDITNSNIGPWTCTGIVHPDGLHSISWSAGLYVQQTDVNHTLATPPGQPLQMGKGKPITVPFLIGTPCAFTPVTQLTGPTTGGTNQLLCTFQFTDGSKQQITSPGAPFTAQFTAYGALPLADYFAFYVGDTPESAQPVTTISSDKHVVAVDTLPSDLTTLKCWVVPQPNVANVVVDLRASVESHELSFGSLLVADVSETAQVSSYLPPLLVYEDVELDTVTFDSDLTALHLCIDTSNMVSGSLEQGDKLLLVINGQVSTHSGVATYDANDPGKLLFVIQYDEPLLNKGTQDTPGQNLLQYVTWRPRGENDPLPIAPTPFLSQDIQLPVKVDQSNPPSPGPLNNPTPNYGRPCIFELLKGTTLESAMIAKGINAQVTWSGPNQETDPDTSNWTPNSGDVIEVDLWLDGWGPDGSVKQATATTSYTLKAADLANNSKYKLIPLEEEWFSNYGNQGAQGTGKHSSLQMQYSVTPGHGTTSYSDVYTCKFNTIEPGSGVG